MFKVEEHWNAITNGMYNKVTAQESDIRSPIHRMLHCLITNTINERQEGDKCPVDVFFSWAITSTDIYVDLPFHLAEFLAARVAKDRRGSPLYGGVLITRLALSFGVLEKREAVMLTVEPQKPFYVLLYRWANIIVDLRMGGFSIPDDTPRQRVPITLYMNW